jgi:hypothetical protein
MRPELSALYQLLNTLCARAGVDRDAADALIACACTGLDETIATLESRVGELSDALEAAQDRLRDLDGRSSY